MTLAPHNIKMFSAEDLGLPALGQGATLPSQSMVRPDVYQELLNTIIRTTEPRKKRPVEYLLQVLSPVVQGLAAAATTPRYRRNAAFWGTTAAGGLGVFGDIIGERLRREEERRKRALETILAARQIEALKPKPSPLEVFEAQDPDNPNQTIYVDKNTGLPVPYRPPQEKTKEDQYGTVERALPTGETILYRMNKKTGTVEPLTVQETIPGTTNKQPGEPTLLKPGESNVRSVPFVTSIQKPERATRQLVQGADRQYYWVEPGKSAVPTGVFSPKEAKESSEGTIRRTQEEAYSAVALEAVNEAWQALGEKANPQQVAQKAKELLRKRAAQNDELKKHAVGISSAIDKLTRSASNGDELLKLLLTQ